MEGQPEEGGYGNVRRGGYTVRALSTREEDQTAATASCAEDLEEHPAQQ